MVGWTTKTSMECWFEREGLWSYLCNRWLFVVAHGDTSSEQTFTAGVPQGCVWSPYIIKSYIRHLSKQV